MQTQPPLNGAERLGLNAMLRNREHRFAHWIIASVA
jgi:hypothetical protein